MQLESQFQVTLPSNASISTYPDNRPSDFTVKLPSKIRLNGEWEVAIMDIQYPNSGQNIQEDVTIALLYHSQPETKLDEADKPLMTELKKTFGPFLAANPSQFANPYELDYFTIPAGHYQSIQHFLERMNKEMEDVYTRVMGKKTDAKTKLQFHWDEATDRVIGTKAQPAITIMTQNPILSQVLGTNLKKDSAILWTNFNKSFIGINSPQLEILSSMFVYTNIIKYQLVGDKECPLLGVVPIKGTFREQTFWPFNPPYYIPLTNNEIDSINIKLCTDTGKPFPLLRNGKVICRLHFRRRVLML